jgi:NAD(P)-dependent dehydrogenase (short-subunit alcohol dehydrogenase family)
MQRYGKVDVVVSNAAANPSIDPILQTKESVLDKLWEINVKSSILILKVISLENVLHCRGKHGRSILDFYNMASVTVSYLFFCSYGYYASGL